MRGQHLSNLSSYAIDYREKSPKGVFADESISSIAPFRQELRRLTGDDSELDFTYLQGRIESPPYPGTSHLIPSHTTRSCSTFADHDTPGIGDLFSPPYYRFWDGDSPSSVLAAVELVSASISNRKTDVIFAHSDGGATALSAVLHHPHNVKCLVLVSPFPPFDASGRRRLDVSIAGPLVHIPTLFVRGETDPLAHFVNMTRGLVDEKNLTLYSWNGGHESPNSSERGIWAQIAQSLVTIINKE